MKVKVPKEIRIAGHWWSIKYEKGLAHRHKKYGYIDFEGLIIHIEPDIPDSLKSHTLVHELVHSISDQFIEVNAFSESVVAEFAVGTWAMLSDLGVEFDWSDIKEE